MKTEDLVNLQLSNAHAVAKDHTAEKSVQQKMLYVTDVNEKDIFVPCCLTKSVSGISQEDQLDTAFLDTVTDKSTTSSLAYFIETRHRS